VAPVHKGDVKDPSNYHPISVVSVVAKILQKLVSDQLISFLENNQLYHNLQGAYCHSRSSEQILLHHIIIYS